LKTQITNIKEVISFIGTKNFIFNNKNNSKIFKFSSLHSAKKGELTFCNTIGKQGIKLVTKSSATLTICHPSLKNDLLKRKSNYVFIENPRLWFSRCMKKFIVKEIFPGIHNSAIVESKISKSIFVGSQSYIGKNVKIGENTKIFGNVHIRGNTSIGKNCIIDSGSVIGTDGFGLERSNNKKIEMISHDGIVKIEDDVDIGANVCIDKATLDSTIIGKGTKIDNLVYIAHNVKIGKNCVIVGNSSFAGSCVLGDNVFVGMSVTIRDGIKIGKNSIIGMGSVVTKNVSPNVTVMGVPAKQILEK